MASSPLETLRSQTLSSSTPTQLSSITTLSSDGKTLTFQSSPSSPVDATAKYRPTSSVSASYTLASLYLACIHSNSFVAYRKACEKYDVSDFVKASDRNEILGFFGFGGSSASTGTGTGGGGDAVEEGEEESRKRSGGDEDDAVISSEKSSAREEKRRKREKEKRHHHHHEKREKEKRHHHHHHRDKERDANKHKDDEKKSKEVKKDKMPMTNEQVMENLKSVAGKRGENRKVKQDDVEMAEEMDKVVDTTIAESSQPTDDGESRPPPTRPAPIANETDEQRQSREKGDILNALSADGYTLDDDDDDILSNDKEFADKIASSEHPVGDSASILRFSGRDFTRVLDLYLEVKKREDREAALAFKKSTRGGSSKAKAKPTAAGKKSIPKRKPVGIPLIVVPNAMTSPITMINAKEFMCQAKFVPRDVQMKKGARKVPSIKFKRRIAPRLGGKEVEYEVIDNPVTKIKPAEWDRLVAVIAQGAVWQFKGWKWSQPVDIFNRSFGFYIGMEGAPVPKELLNWNVKLAKLNRDKRGLDSVTYASFWNGLDEWMAVHKPEYLPLDTSTL